MRLCSGLGHELRGDALSVELQFMVPSPDLTDHVTLFYHFKTDLPRFEDVERAGHAQIRFRLSGANSRYAFADGTSRRSGAIHLIGPNTGPTRASVDGPAEVVGVRAEPGGLGGAGAVDASAMVNRAVDCHDRFDGIGEVVAAMRRRADDRRQGRGGRRLTCAG